MKIHKSPIEDLKIQALTLNKNKLAIKQIKITHNYPLLDLKIGQNSQIMESNSQKIMIMH